MKKGVYICIEGLDGAGKTTLFNLLCEHLKKNEHQFSTASPTKKMKDSFIEKLFNFNFLKKNTFSRAIVYANRSNSTFFSTNWNSELILGDRSLITSYVTRWRKWANSKRLTILFVNLLEPFIYAPDHIIYIDLPANILRDRLDERGLPLDVDETPVRSEEMRVAYNEIIELTPIPRVKGTKWHKLVLTADDSPHDVLDKSIDVLNRINNVSI